MPALFPGFLKQNMLHQSPAPSTVSQVAPRAEVTPIAALLQNPRRQAASDHHTTTNPPVRVSITGCAVSPATRGIGIQKPEKLK